MSQHQRRLQLARAYSGAVIGAGAGVLALRLPEVRLDEPFLFLVLLAGSFVISGLKVPLPMARGKATLSMSYFTDFLALVLLGADEGMIIAGASAAAQCLLNARGRPSMVRTLFSAATLVITIQTTGLVASALGGFPNNAPLVLSQTTIAAIILFFALNSWLVATAVALDKNEPVARTWYDHFLWTAPACFIGAGLAVLLSATAGAFVWVPVLAFGPLFVTFKAYRIYLGRVEEQQHHVKEISDLHFASVEALARAIDARDQTIENSRSGENHVRRLQAWATSLAEAAGMTPDDIEAVKVAALLHDIGKLAVPEHILTKPGRLTAKEFARVRIHPVVGAEIIKAVPFRYPVAPLIRSHHERWDGTGYPDGLRGEQTPLGARVLAVVDYFDALTSTRPYHGPTAREQALRTLQSEAGRALDPLLVDLFIGILPGLDKPESTVPSAVRCAAKAGQVVAPSTGFADDPARATSSWVYQNISLATQEMRALHDIAQTLGTRLSVDDTMALLTSKLNRLVPGSSWVLFLHERGEDLLRCRFATGLPAEITARLTIPNGKGPSGWAARNRTAALNGHAAADFEAAGQVAAGRAFQSALSYPLIDGDELIGTLTVYHVDVEPFRDEHRHVLDHISPQVASVLRNAVAFERMRDVSFTDPLTELPNSRALAEFLRQNVVDAKGKHSPTALIMVDLDDFKAVNDGHGHQKGDAALKAVAETIRSHVRGSDFCARYGGDEFVVVLSDCDRAEAEERAYYLQDAVARVVLEAANGDVLTLGISVGVSVFPHDGVSIDHLITAADRRMYLNKSGRRGLGELSAISAIRYQNSV
jgi:diguanylate cyclase (GGDEF)-like protein/putative nucleotidyltransferase with HDIG domain